MLKFILCIKLYTKLSNFTNLVPIYITMKKLYKANSFFCAFAIAAGLFSACTNTTKPTESKTVNVVQKDSLINYVAGRLPIYERVKLTTNLNQLSVNDRKVLPLLIQAA